MTAQNEESFLQPVDEDEEIDIEDSIYDDVEPELSNEAAADTSNRSVKYF